MKKAKINELRKVASWWGDTLSVALPGLATYGIARGLGAGNGLALGLGAAAGGAGLYAKKKWLDPAWDAAAKRAELENNAKKKAEDESLAERLLREHDERRARALSLWRLSKQYPLTQEWVRTEPVKSILNPEKAAADIIYADVDLL